MIVTPPATGLQRSADVDVSDLTSSVRIGPARWVDETSLEIPFDPEPSVAEQALIRRRLLTGDEADEALVAHMQALVDDLAADTSTLATAVRLLLAERLGPLRGAVEVTRPGRRRQHVRGVD